MHPAFSVIFFTTASGAGYGILAILSGLLLGGVIPADRTLGIAGLGISVVLVSAGLLSSTFHLGHPERAWRAFTQWRSSWLSREGVLSVLTYVPWVVMAFGWIYLETAAGIYSFAAAACAVLAVITIYCTAMIYRSLKTIHQWSNKWTVPVYLALAVASGAVWTAGILSLTVGVASGYMAFTVVTVVVAWRVKRHYWLYIDNTQHAASPQSATGLKGDTVRMLEGPHTEENYLQREMGFKIARKHAARLRNIVHLAAFLAPAMFLVLAYVAGDPIMDILCSLSAMAFISIGVVVERWLFFAEAKHVVTLYYGAQVA